MSGELSIVELEVGQDPEPEKGGGLVREHHQHREGEEETTRDNLRGMPSVRDPQKGGNSRIGDLQRERGKPQKEDLYVEEEGC